ncbi:hypothetical protein HW132_36160 [Brasilonema sp. CT11]|nr:hypothetical protein [Brasilonema sp. CT11]
MATNKISELQFNQIEEISDEDLTGVVGGCAPTCGSPIVKPPTCGTGGLGSVVGGLGSVVGGVGSVVGGVGSALGGVGSVVSGVGSALGGGGGSKC